ncbi:hypothetical protein ACFQV2_03470 [Actinokineospora soli]|uniref:Uncharacterized protein n=1 Tax=Actinokineospora soli TaxID=1048753 RepID=A0ABW2TJ17_9PSEU
MPTWKSAVLALECLGESDPGAGLCLDDLFDLLPERPMAVFTVAEPLPGAQLVERIGELSTVVHDLETRREGRGADRLRLARADAELAHFEHAAALGAWRLRVWTAAADDRECDAVAAMVGGCSDLLAGPCGCGHPASPRARCWTGRCRALPVPTPSRPSCARPDGNCRAFG